MRSVLPLESIICIMPCTDPNDKRSLSIYTDTWEAMFSSVSQLPLEERSSFQVEMFQELEPGSSKVRREERLANTLAMNI